MRSHRTSMLILGMGLFRYESASRQPEKLDGRTNKKELEKKYQKWKKRTSKMPPIHWGRGGKEDVSPHFVGTHSPRLALCMFRCA